MFTKYILLNPALMQGNCSGSQSHEASKFTKTYSYVYIWIYKFEEIYIYLHVFKFCFQFFNSEQNNESSIKKFALRLSLEKE